MTAGGHVCIVSAAPECHHSDDAHMWTLEQGDTGVWCTLDTGRRHHAVTARHSAAVVTS